MPVDRLGRDTRPPSGLSSKGNPPPAPACPGDPTRRIAVSPVVPSPDHTPHTPLPPPAPRWPELPGYDILGELGRGGMGVVYKARQRALSRTVAVKTLLPHNAHDPADVARFHSEAEAVAAVAHPHVVKVFESDQHRGVPYFVMEYLSGGSLHARLRASAPLAAAAAAALVGKLARAVHAAHQQGIVHRDLKPGNVLFDADGEPRVTDFGLAKRSSQQLTRTQTALGTPAYMPPEQAAGRTRYAGPPADIYALGVILYECLTGHTPFAGDDSLLLMAQVVHTPPPPPRSRVAAVPRDVELICLKCLEKGPADRYPTAAALADDLRRFGDREPVSVRPAGPLERAVKWARRRPTLAAAYVLAAAAAALSLFGGGMSALWGRADVARREAAGQWRSAEDARSELVGRNGDLQEALGRETAAKAAAVQARTEADAARGDLERLAYFRDVGLACGEARAGNVLRARQLLAACPKEARNWEWYYADRLAHPEVRSFQCRMTDIDLRYTADGRGLLAADSSGGFTRLDLACDPGKTTGVAVAPSDRHYQVRLTADGKRLVAASFPSGGKQPGRVGVWQTADGKRLGDWPIPNDHLLLLTASADGGRVLAGFQNHTLMAFAPGESEPVWVLDDLLWDPQRVDVSPDGRWAVIDSHTDMALVNLAEGRVAARLEYREGRLESSAFSADGARFAVGTNSGHVVWYERGKKQPYRVTRANSGGVTAVAFSPDGRLVACGGRDGAVRLLSAETGAEEAAYHGHTCRVPVLRFNPDGSEVVSSDDAGRCYCWAVGRTHSPAAPLRLPPDLAGPVQVSHDLGRVFAREPNRPATVGDVDGRRRTPVPTPHGGVVFRFAFQPGGPGFACGTGNGEVEHWPTPDGPPIRVADHGMYVNVVQYSGDGRLLLSASGHRVCVWDTVAKKDVYRAAGVGDVAAVSPDGKRVAVVTGDRCRVVDLATGEAAEWACAPSVSTIQFTPDSAGLLVGQLTWGAYLFKLTSDGNPTGPPRKFPGHSSAVRSFAVSADGKRVAAGGDDGVVKVWDEASGQEVMGLSVGDRKPVAHLFFADGGRLVATPEDGRPTAFDGSPRLPAHTSRTK